MNDEMDDSRSDALLAGWARALSHPARLAILRALAEKQTCFCGELVEVLPLAQSTVSQHLKVLRSAGLIEGETEGPRSCYCLAVGTLRRVRAELDALLAGLDGGCACTSSAHDPTTQPS